MTLFKSALIAIGLAALAAPTAVVAQSDAQALQHARQDYQAAVKTHNPQAIAQAKAALRTAYSDSAVDAEDAAALKANPPAGESRDDYLALTRARIEYREAMRTHDKAEIANAKAAVRAASDRIWYARHPKKS